jgi:hypothetical protein
MGRIAFLVWVMATVVSAGCDGESRSDVQTCNFTNDCSPGQICEEGICVEGTAMSTPDGGIPADAGSMPDAGTSPEAGPTPDAGAVIDAGGAADSGTIAVPDGGTDDGGDEPTPDSGTSSASDGGVSALDSGALDSGVSGDSGASVIDSGSGLQDSGTPATDGGMPLFDGGASPEDSGSPRVDAGPPDSGLPPVGPLDGGANDAGDDAGLDAGADSGVDSGTDSGVDAGSPRVSVLGDYLAEGNRVATAGTNRLFLYFILIQDTTAMNPTDVQWGGQPLTEAPGFGRSVQVGFDSQVVEVWYLKDTDFPTDGVSHSITWNTPASPDHFFGYSLILENVDQTEPFGDGDPVSLEDQDIFQTVELNPGPRDHVIGAILIDDGEGITPKNGLVTQEENVSAQVAVELADLESDGSTVRVRFEISDQQSGAMTGFVVQAAP